MNLIQFVEIAYKVCNNQENKKAQQATIFIQNAQGWNPRTQGPIQKRKDP
jgi:hypothetical protein